MGYESKLYIVEKGYKIEGEEKVYSSPIIVYDLCKFYDVSDFMREQPQTDAFFYMDDGNTEVTEDMYGEPLTECELTKFLTFMKGIMSNPYNINYRRIPPLMAILETLAKQLQEGVWRNLYVLHFGY